MDSRNKIISFHTVQTSGSSDQPPAITNEIEVEGGDVQIAAGSSSGTQQAPQQAHAQQQNDLLWSESRAGRKEGRPVCLTAMPSPTTCIPGDHMRRIGSVQFIRKAIRARRQWQKETGFSGLACIITTIQWRQGQQPQSLGWRVRRWRRSSNQRQK